MPHDDVRAAARERDRGMRRIGQITWRAGLAGAACSAVVAAAFGHHSVAAAGSTTNHRHPVVSHAKHRDHGAIIIPAKPPKLSGGAGQVVSGGS